MKLHQNPEKMHSGSHTKPGGSQDQRGMLLPQFLPSFACTNLSHHSLHKSGVGGKACGTSRAQRTFCSLAAPPAPPGNMLSYLASSKLNIFIFSNKFYWVLHYLALTFRKLRVSYRPFLGRHHKALPKVKDDFAFAPRAQNMQLCWKVLSALCVDPQRRMRLAPQHSFNFSAPRKGVLTLPAQK